MSLSNPKRIHAVAALVAVLAALAFAAQADAAPKKRIVAITPFSANVLVKLGVKPVAIGEGQGGARKLDRRLRRVPRLPLSHASNGPNLEQLVEYNPDLLFSERTWSAGHDAIRDLGIKVVEADPYSLGAVKQKVLRIGRAVGRVRAARKLAKQLATKINRSSRNRPSAKPRVLLILGVGQTPYAFLPDSWGGNVLERAGADLLTRGLSNDGEEDLLVSGGYAQLSDEEIIARNPDVIIAVPHGRGEDLSGIAESLRDDPVFESTNAGANGRIYVTLDNTLLQASTEVAATITKVRKRYLRNFGGAQGR